MPPRLRRLVADNERIASIFNGQHPYITVVTTEGRPPEKYTVRFTVTGLREESDNSIVKVGTHEAEIYLPADYPRRAPFCRMITPVFHPNIDSQKICIGDHWAAGESLDLLIVRIGEMICFQRYNIKSPLNAKASAWTEQHVGELPLDPAELAQWL